jgi:DNA-binding transcriptional MerR regulator
MPLPKVVLNAFPPREVNQITGLSLPMLDYLSRMDFLRPSYSVGPGVRGRVRYYSYRDLVVARIVQRLREAGVELSRLKSAIRELSRDETWAPATDKDNPAKTLNWLVSDGKNVFFRHPDGFLEDLNSSGQRSFAFVVNLDNAAQEVKRMVPLDKQRYYSLVNEPLVERKEASSKEN